MSEQVSALMDDEIQLEDAKHLFVSMHSSKQSTDAWRQYHLIGDVMRGDPILSKNFKQSLMQQIDMEPTVLAPKPGQINAEKVQEFKDKLPVKWSIAASFAAVMVVGWMAMHQVPLGNQAPAIEIASADVAEQSIPNEYLAAHLSSVPSASSYYIQSVSYAE